MIPNWDSVTSRVTASNASKPCDIDPLEMLKGRPASTTAVPPFVLIGESKLSFSELPEAPVINQGADQHGVEQDDAKSDFEGTLKCSLQAQHLLPGLQVRVILD